jgi:methyl-accepting chemotaxis protein
MNGPHVLLSVADNLGVPLCAQTGVRLAGGLAGKDLPRMNRSSIGLRLIVSTLLVVSLTGVAFGVVAWEMVSSQVRQQATAESARQSSKVIARLATIDQLSRALVESGMRILQDEAGRKGAAALDGTASIDGKPVPNLVLGKESQVLNFAVVDHVKELAGGTATMFAWDGRNFIRVTTNVLKPDGSRAVGTALDPKGKAFAALAQSRSFAGVVDILGIPYTTSYVPIQDFNGNLIGAWYTGYRLDSIATLGKSIEEATILDHGFVALMKSSGAIVFHGGKFTEGELERLMEHPSGWVFHKEEYPAWDYTVLAAYPTSDVRSRLWRTTGFLASAIVVLLSLIILLQFFLLRRHVLAPVRHLTERLAKADLNTLLESEKGDEIGDLAAGFNQFVLRLRQTLLKVRDGSNATSAKSGEISNIGRSTVTDMNAQRELAEDANRSIAELSRGIASISSHTRNASEQARSAASAAREGGTQVAAAVTEIQALSEETQLSASRISTLSDRAKQIGSIVGVIEEIAAGTNLLALNASIEAARAGEHGRGFAVVAGEVRRLSERTAQATREVADLVSGIENETEQASVGIHAACDRAAAGAAVVATLNATFERIAGLVIEVDSRVEEIARAADRESSATQAVTSTIGKVALSAAGSAQGAERVVAATGELQITAKGLEGLVKQFQLRALPQDSVR